MTIFPEASRAWITRGLSSGKLASADEEKAANESAVISSVATGDAENGGKI